MDHIMILERLTQAYSDILGENFVGMYAHGSIAMGCFHPVRSDIDFVCIVHEEPNDGQKIRILQITVEHERFSPEKGLEMHILKKYDCMHPSHPCPFCLHYSPAHRQAFLTDAQAFVSRMKGNDPDLCGHLTILNAFGLCLKGPAASEIFAPVPRQMYLDSILDDVFSGCGDEIYRICNLCRVWGYLAEEKLLSKKTGAIWALGQEGCPVDEVRAALDCYTGGKKWNGSGEKACAVLREKIVSLLPEEFKEKYA